MCIYYCLTQEREKANVIVDEGAYQLENALDATDSLEQVNLKQSRQLHLQQQQIVQFTHVYVYVLTSQACLHSFY